MKRIILALLLTACGDKSDDTGDGSTDGGAGDGGSGDGGAGDGGADGGSGDGGGGGGGDCSNVFPVDQTGASWRYIYTGPTTGSWTQVAVGMETYKGAEAWRIDGTGNIEGTGYTQSWTMATWYSCGSEGVKILGSEMTYEGTSGSSGYSGWTTTSYTTPPLVSPKNLAEGDSWTASYEGSTTSSAGGETPFSYSQTSTVTGTDSVTVEAGSFDTLVVQYSGSGAAYEQHLAVGVGAVIGDGFELASFTP